MSEPMSKGEIEDVLSSIRRLVSEDLRPQARAREGAGQPAAPAARAPEAETTAEPETEGKAPQGPQPDARLLLTPALRVVADRTASPLHLAEVARPVTPLPRLHLGIETPGPATAADRFMAGSVNAESDFESEIGDPYPDATRMEWTESGWALTQDPGVVAAADVFPDPWSEEPEVSDQPVEEAVGPKPEAAVEAASGRGEDLIDEGDGAEDWADAAEAEALAELDAAPLSTAAEPASRPLVTEGDDPLEVVFDEQVLRDLVREILREELQGRLGERITRNIRKLVHAEMARLSATQDLEDY